jgi:hypothetical protein
VYVYHTIVFSRQCFPINFHWPLGPLRTSRGFLFFVEFGSLDAWVAPDVAEIVSLVISWLIRWTQKSSVSSIFVRPTVDIIALFRYLISAFRPRLRWKKIIIIVSSISRSYLAEFLWDYLLIGPSRMHHRVWQWYKESFMDHCGRTTGVATKSEILNLLGSFFFCVLLCERRLWPRRRDKLRP